MSDMSGPPFRADHVGSLLRPPELLRARAEHQAGRLSAEELRRVEDTAIRDVARMQQEIGLTGVTDGEFRRGSWHMDFLYQIGGVAKTDQTLRIQFRNEAGPVEAALGAFRIGRRLTLDKTIFAEDFAYLKSVAPAGTVAEIDDPVTLDAALPRRPGGDRPGRLSRDGGLLARPRRGLPEGDRRPRRTRLHLSAARRHQPCLSQRPGTARLCRRASAATATSSI